MPYDEFPHEVEILEEVPGVEDDSGGFTEGGWHLVFKMDAFVDTPTSNERYTAMQLENPLDRYMYYEFRTDIKNTYRVKHDDDTYELAGKPEDQGGQHEKMRVALKLVTK